MSHKWMDASGVDRNHVAVAVPSPAVGRDRLPVLLLHLSPEAGRGHKTIKPSKNRIKVGRNAGSAGDEDRC